MKRMQMNCTNDYLSQKKSQEINSMAFEIIWVKNAILLIFIFRLSFDFIFMSPEKHGRHIGIMAPSSSASALSYFWFPIDTF